MSDSASWFAVDVVRAGLDPLTGRTLSYNHVPMAAWAGHLCDLTMLGTLTDRAGTAVAVREPEASVVHPLVAQAWSHVAPRLPRPWRLLFGLQTVDINQTANDARTWLVDVGLWSRHRTVFGWRYSRTGNTPTSLPPEPPGSPLGRQLVLQALLRVAQVGDQPSGHAGELRQASADDGEHTLQAILATTAELVAWKSMNPTLLHPGM